MAQGPPHAAKIGADSCKGRPSIPRHSGGGRSGEIEGRERKDGAFSEGFHAAGGTYYDENAPLVLSSPAAGTGR